MYSLRKVGFGPTPPLPAGFGPGISLALTTYSRRPSALTETEFGYQVVGIRPTTL